VSSTKEINVSDREIMSFGGEVHEVGFNPDTLVHEVVIKIPRDTLTLSGITPEMAKEFAHNLYQTIYVSITVKP
jgi:hypothetical protein